MNSSLIQSFADRDKATQEKNEAILRALEYANQCTREQIEWNKNAIEGLRFKPQRYPAAEGLIWLGVGVSAITFVVVSSILIWNWGA